MSLTEGQSFYPVAWVRLPRVGQGEEETAAIELGNHTYPEFLS